MSLNERETLIVIIVCSISGFLLLLFIICLFFWFTIRHYRLKSKRFHMNDDNESPVMRQRYQRSQNLPANKIEKRNRLRRKRKERFNTNNSSISSAFDPPHLINQNVRNLDQLLNSEGTITTNSWQYEETLPKKPWYSYKTKMFLLIFFYSSCLLVILAR